VAHSKRIINPLVLTPKLVDIAAFVLVHVTVTKYANCRNPISRPAFNLSDNSKNQIDHSVLIHELKPDSWNPHDQARSPTPKPLTEPGLFVKSAFIRSV